MANGAPTPAPGWRGFSPDDRSTGRGRRTLDPVLRCAGTAAAGEGNRRGADGNPPPPRRRSCPGLALDPAAQPGNRRRACLRARFLRRGPRRTAAAQARVARLHGALSLCARPAHGEGRRAHDRRSRGLPADCLACSRASLATSLPPTGGACARSSKNRRPKPKRCCKAMTGRPSAASSASTSNSIWPSARCARFAAAMPCPSPNWAKPSSCPRPSTSCNSGPFSNIPRARPIRLSPISIPRSGSA